MLSILQRKRPELGRYPFGAEFLIQTIYLKPFQPKASFHYSENENLSIYYILHNGSEMRGTQVIV